MPHRLPDVVVELRDSEWVKALFAAAKLMAAALEEMQKCLTYDPMYQHIDTESREVALVDGALAAWAEVSDE